MECQSSIAAARWVAAAAVVAAALERLAVQMEVDCSYIAAVVRSVD